MKKANSSDPIEKLLWHGSSCKSKNIMEKDGFSSQFAKDYRMWGRAIYFAQLANYSHNYAEILSKNERCLFFASVLTGKHIEMASNSNLRVPPDGYDSVKGKTLDTDVYMVYQNDKTYPMFYVKYQH